MCGYGTFFASCASHSSSSLSLSSHFIRGAVMLTMQYMKSVPYTSWFQCNPALKIPGNPYFTFVFRNQKPFCRWVPLQVGMSQRSSGSFHVWDVQLLIF